MGIKLGKMGMTLSKIWATILCFIEHGPMVGHIAIELEGDRVFGRLSYLSSIIHSLGMMDISLDKRGGWAANLYQFNGTSWHVFSGQHTILNHEICGYPVLDFLKGTWILKDQGS